MEEKQPEERKGQMIALMQAGHSWQEAAAMAGVQIGRSAAYQLLRNVRLEEKPPYRMASMGILPNCANPYGSSSKRPVARLIGKTLLS